MTHDIVDLICIDTAVEKVGRVAVAVHPLNEHRGFAEYGRIHLTTETLADRDVCMEAYGLDQVMLDLSARLQDGRCPGWVLAENEGHQFLTVTPHNPRVKPERFARESARNHGQPLDGHVISVGECASKKLHQLIVHEFSSIGFCGRYSINAKSARSRRHGSGLSSRRETRQWAE